jgi:hypothetical protein
LSPEPTRPRLGLLALVAVAFAFAWPLQGVGSLQNAHYVLVRALASGTAVVDKALGEVSEVGTNDLTVFEGNRYSNKPPGLALAVLPAFVVLDAFGLADDPDRVLWALGLLGVVLPAVGLVVLVRRVADRLEPGFGTAAAVTLGLGTLLLPYTTLFLNHALSSFLVFASFALLWRERRGEPSLPLIGVAGLVAGLATVAEYTHALAVVVLGAYALTRTQPLARLGAWVAGAAVGAAPIAVYNQVAFGSITHTSYDASAELQAADLFGAPSLDVALELLLSRHGLFVVCPVLVLGAAGLVLLARRGWVAEALVAAALVAAYVAFDSAFYSPFGGFSPGPRYLVPVIPFLALGLAPMFRTMPLVTGALALASTLAMAGLTATHPQAGWDGRWLNRLLDGDMPLTAASFAGITGWYAFVPFFAAVAAALVLAALAAPPLRVRPLEPVLAGAALLAWALAALVAPQSGRGGDYASHLPLVAILLAVALSAAGPRTLAAPFLRYKAASGRE